VTIPVMGRQGPTEPALEPGEGGGSMAEAYARARSAASERHPIRVIVLGEPHRGDDGAAFLAVRVALVGLAPDVIDLLDVRETGQLDPADLVELAATGRAILVDAVVGVPPGEIVVLPLSELAAWAIGGTAGAAVPRSTHVLPVDQLVALAAALRGSPPPGVLVGLGSRGFDLGAGLSEPVTAALPAFGAAIQAEIDRAVDAVRQGA
jgi:hydrogenase maturation protease